MLALVVGMYLDLLCRHFENCKLFPLLYFRIKFRDI